MLAPKAPEKTADKTYIYVFSGWDSEIVSCVSDATYTVTYEARYIDYTVTFKNEDGTVLSSKTYHYGDKIDVPTSPSNPSDSDMYEFAGWDSTVAEYCDGNKVYTATFALVEQPAEEQDPVNPAAIVAIVGSSAAVLGTGGFFTFRFIKRKKEQ